MMPQSKEERAKRQRENRIRDREWRKNMNARLVELGQEPIPDSFNTLRFANEYRVRSDAGWKERKARLDAEHKKRLADIEAGRWDWRTDPLIDETFRQLMEKIEETNAKLDAQLNPAKDTRTREQKLRDRLRGATDAEKAIINRLLNKPK